LELSSDALILPGLDAARDANIEMPPPLASTISTVVYSGTSHTLFYRVWEVPEPISILKTLTLRGPRCNILQFLDVIVKAERVWYRILESTFV